MHELDPSVARKMEVKSRTLFSKQVKLAGKIEDIMIRGADGINIPIRIYMPEAPKKCPVVVFLHGGGWVLGDLDMFHETCTLLTNLTGSITISVDYRLSPEHKFPVALQDCYSAIDWAANNAKSLGADESMLIVVGDSSGANLATGSCMLARDKGKRKILRQVLLYPWVDLTRDVSNSRAVPSKEDLDWFKHHYLTSQSEATIPFVSPSFADLKGLPGALIVVAEYDSLKEQDLEFAKRLEEAGVKVKVIEFEGMVHGFVQFPGFFKAGRSAIEKIAEEFRSLNQVGLG